MFRSRSRDWTCPHCQQTNLELLPDPVAVEHPVSRPEDLDSTDVQEKAETTTKVETTDTTDTSSSAAATTNPPTAPQSNAAASEPHVVEVSPPSQVSHSVSSVTDSPTPPATSILPRQQVAVQRSSHIRAPILLDSAICVILVLVFALICRRML